MNQTHLIAQKVWDKFNVEDTFDISEFQNLSSDGIVDFLVYNFINYPNLYVIRLLLNTSNIWMRLNLMDWKEVFIKISSNEIAFYNCIAFLYKYIRIDSIELFKGIGNDEIKSDVKSRVLSYFENNPALLKITFMEKNLVETTGFFADEYRSTLIEQGVSKVEPEIIERKPFNG